MKEKERTCPHCLHTGSDVIERTGYVGGQGNVTTLECENQVECWERWDKIHNFLEHGDLSWLEGGKQ